MKAPMHAAFLTMLVFSSTSFRSPLKLNKAFAGKNTFSVIILKGNYELQLYDSTGDWLASYPVVFGNTDKGDKMMQGDRKTPEGVFHIAYKRKHEKWDSFLLIDYPTKESYQKFKQRKEEGLIPADAKIGGDIGIHGTWPHEDYAIDQYRNWTEGCISTKNKYIEELFQLLPVGTKIEIRR